MLAPLSAEATALIDRPNFAHLATLDGGRLTSQRTRLDWARGRSAPGVHE